MLAGQMSLIGYRPSQSCENELNEARESYDMYQIRPGISGWAQVNGRDVLAAHPKKKAEYDAYYLRHFSLWLDIKIFFMTIIKVFKSDSVVEGVIDEAQNEASNEEPNEPLAFEEAAATESAIQNIIDYVETVNQEEAI